MLRRALAILQKNTPVADVDAAAGLNNLGEIHVLEHHYAEAVDTFRQAISMFEKTLGPEHPSTGRAKANFAVALLFDGRTDKAEPVFEAALATLEKGLGRDHPDLAIVLLNGAEMYRRQGAFPRAELLLYRAIDLAE